MSASTKIEAGNTVRYQHFNPLKPDSPETRVCDVVEWTTGVSKK